MEREARDGHRRPRRPLAGRRAHPGGRRPLHDRAERRRDADAPRRTDRRGVALLRAVEHGDARARFLQPARRRLGGRDRTGQGRNADPPLHREPRHGPHAAGGVHGAMAEAHPRGRRRDERHGLLLRPLPARGAGRSRGCHRHLLGRHARRGMDGPRDDGRLQGVRPLVPRRRREDRPSPEQALRTLQRHDRTARALHRQGIPLVPGRIEPAAARPVPGADAGLREDAPQTLGAGRTAVLLRADRALLL